MQNIAIPYLKARLKKNRKARILKAGKEDTMQKQRAKRILLIAAIACFAIAALLLLLTGQRRAPVFAEFSEADALDAHPDCYLNEIRVLDLYADRSTGGRTESLYLVSYADRDDRPVVLSLLVRSDEPVSEQLLPYAAQEGEIEAVVLSGYCFTDSLIEQGTEAISAFQQDANAYLAWASERGEEKGNVSETVLRYAGATEESYRASIRKRTLPATVSAIALGISALGLAVAAGCISKRISV